MASGCAPEDGLPWLRDGGATPGPVDGSGQALWDAGAPADAAAPSACDFSGTWILTYTEARAMDRGSLPMGCVPTRDVITVTARGGGLVDVRFSDLEPQLSTCTATPTPGTKEASAMFFESSCVLDAVWKISWCASGEQQCENRRVNVRAEAVAGENRVTGTLTYNRCWCGGGPAGVPITAKVTATRM
jgi:hypothetical protein